jgi:hypothetical protein
VGETIVFIPKYTTLCGTTDYYSDPYEVTGYKTVSIETLLLAIIGTASPAASATLQGSSDLITWATLDGPNSLSAGTIDNLSASAPPRYVRVKITTSGGTNMSVTLWCKGVARDS